ncbi:MAG: C40 family peptidase [Methylococcaceae bacterium]|nr:C40 family peptidase [Methylococcaceae bacterium]
MLSLRWFLIIAVLLVTGCASSPEIKPVIVQPHTPVVAYALSLQGIPYRYGKESPREGFDCSGFVQHVYEHHGISLPRTTREMAASLPPVPKSQLRSGDLVFFNTHGKTISHVGIYVDNSKFVHAPSRHTGRVLVSSLNNRYWRKRFVGVRRP